MKNLVVCFLLLNILSLNVSVLRAQDKNAEPKKDSPVTGKHQLGENYGGGKIFWLDETGQHGLIAASSDQSAKGVAWNPGKLVATGANADVLYSGLKNSEKIISVQGSNEMSAARLCLDLAITSNNIVYNDWYLPSRFELNLLYQQKMLIGGFNIISGIYWSSTETTTNPEGKAWEQEFKFGSKHEDDKDMPDQIRCIRKF
jgi:hypothetical protein